jgi:hypothetical protein
MGAYLMEEGPYGYDAYREDYSGKRKNKESSIGVWKNKDCQELDEIRRINRNRLNIISKDDIIDLKILIGLHGDDSERFLSEMGYRKERKPSTEQIVPKGMAGYSR